MHSKISTLIRQTAGQFRQSKYSTDVDFKVRVDKNNPRLVKGYLAVFNVPDSYRTVAVPGCFAKSIRERGPQSSAKNKIIFLAFHDATEPIGQFTVLREDSYGLYFEALIDDTAGTPQRCLDQIRSGTINQYSYGFDYVPDKLVYNEETDLILMHEVVLIEGSCLAIDAANPETYTVRTKKQKTLLLEQTNQEVEEILTSLPIKKQIQLRQIVTRYNSLVNSKPLIKSALRKSKPKKTVKIGSFNLNPKQFRK